MSKTTYIVLLVLGVIGVFVAFAFFSGDANAANATGTGGPSVAPPYNGSANGTAPGGASGTDMPKAVKYGLLAYNPVWYVANRKVVGQAWNKIKSIF